MGKQAFGKSIETNQQDSLAWYGKGLALNKLNKDEEAIMAFDKSIETNPRIQ